MKSRYILVITKTLLALAVCGSLASCGGSSSASALNSYPGTWSGSIDTVTSTNTLINAGSLSIVIDAGGNVTGTDTITVPGTTTVDTGSIDSTGDLSLSTTASGSTTVVGAITGILTNIQNQLQGSGQLTVGSTSTNVTIDLNLTSTATDKNKR
jgi:hypothetical protein